MNAPFGRDLMNDDRVRAGDLDVAREGGLGRAGRAALRRLLLGDEPRRVEAVLDGCRPEVPVPVVGDRLRVERRAVGELHALAERDRDGLGVGAVRVAGGQVGDDLPAGAELEELPVDRGHEVLGGGALLVFGRVEGRPRAGVPGAFEDRDRTARGHRGGGCGGTAGGRRPRGTTGCYWNCCTRQQLAPVRPPQRGRRSALTKAEISRHSPTRD